MLRRPAAERRDPLVSQLAPEALLKRLPALDIQLRQEPEHRLRADPGFAGETRHRPETGSGIMLAQMRRGARFLHGQARPDPCDRRRRGLGRLAFSDAPRPLLLPSHEYAALAKVIGSFVPS